MQVLTLFIVIVLTILFIGYFNKQKTDKMISTDSAERHMQLIVQSDFIENLNADREVVSKEPTVQIIKNTIESIDWNIPHLVQLVIKDSDYIQVAGSLDPEFGLSSMYQENGNSFVMSHSPESTGELVNILESYLEGNWKAKYKWE